ncbi:BAG domain-containing protein Samui-like [Neodiprion virginianus]|uniref:BAG domain-containing protein Samui-like n=1 Tax=Neodiprion virginianus TaxID=2961670 RepID=UPI001EE6D79D|nr:BAG domain-containing protein Samui-like [Neodiprion virginianus]
MCPAFRNLGDNQIIQLCILKIERSPDSKSFFEPTTASTGSSQQRGSRDREHPFERHHTGFPRGFPFDDDGFDGGSRRAGGNIRSHLDDLAARHPEFADHLLGPPWADVPFPLGTPRNRRRGSGLGSSSSYQSHPDEDARSQASGSSAASAASGASGVSSHGEADTGIYQEQQQQEERERNDKRSNKGNNQHYQPIPQYGLRNTVDIGQHRHDMENSENEKTNRGQRSASAPPENRQTAQNFNEQNHQQQASQQQSGQNQGSNPNQRFVSRVDITPQQQQSDVAKPPMSPKLQQQQQHQPHSQSSHQTSSGQQQQTHQQKSNVRHIPIFVEGRDEPVIPKNVVDETSSGQFAGHQQQKRPQSPPQFQRPSHFNQHFTGGGNRHHQQWQQPQQQQFYHQQPAATAASQHEQQIPKANHYQQQQQQYRQQQAEKQRAAQQQQQQQQREDEPAAEPPKLKQIQPKEPLERVAIVQNDVDSLMEEVKQFQGDSRQSKEYMYLDEMLTRELIKLDDIETEGKPEVRQARKNAIKSIQDCIAMLESKVPLPGQEVIKNADSTTAITDQGKSALPMETDAETVKSDLSNNPNGAGDENAAIPLPPPENSVLSQQPKDQVTHSQGVDAGTAVKDQDRPEERRNVDEAMNEDAANDDPAAATEALIQTEKSGSVTAMETQQDGGADSAKKTADEAMESNQAAGGDPGQHRHQQQQMDVDAAAAAATKTTSKSPRKTRKAKQPKPVSDVPIPLPPPEVSHT